MYTKYYLLVIYHVLNFVMINKGCLVSQTMPGFQSFVDLGALSIFGISKTSTPCLKEAWLTRGIFPKPIVFEPLDHNIVSNKKLCRFAYLMF